MNILIEDADNAAEQLCSLLEVMYQQGIDDSIPEGHPLIAIAYNLSAKVSNYTRQRADIEILKDNGN